MNARFTAFNISSTHMKMMIALRRVSTPTTPITKRTAEKKSDSASIVRSLHAPAAAQNDRADDGREQQDARQLEGQQIFGEQGLRDRRNGAAGRDVFPDETRRERHRVGDARARERQ